MALWLTALTAQAQDLGSLTWLPKGPMTLVTESLMPSPDLHGCCVPWYT